MMRYWPFRKRLACALGLCLLMAGCGDGLPEQAELTFIGSPDRAEFAALSSDPSALGPERRQRFEKELKRRLHASVSYTVLKEDLKAPYAGFGYVAGPSVIAYAISRDGTGIIAKEGVYPVELEKIAPRLEASFVGGKRGRHIISYSPNGTAMSWNTGNLRQQTVLRPQQTTFSQKHAFHVLPLEGSNTLAMATQDRTIEIWNLTSGSLIRKKDFRSLLPRRIAKGSTLKGVVFGTDNGHVHFWNTGRRSKFLYSHKGPVLDMVLEPTRQLVISAGKDGQVLVWSAVDQAIRYQLEFPKAVYRLTLANQGQYLIATPAAGRPHILDLDTGRKFSFPVWAGRIVSDITILPGGKSLIAQHGHNALTLWNLELDKRIAHITPAQGGAITSYAVSPEHNLLALATADGRLQYWDMREMKYRVTALRASKGIMKIAISPDGRQILVGTGDGKVVSLKIDRSQHAPIRIGTEDDTD